MSRTLGIDLGTSKLAAYRLRDGVPVRVLGAMPAAVFVGDDELVVGEPALAAGKKAPRRLVGDVKRLLGRKYYGPESTWLAEASSYELVPADNGDAWIRIEGRDFSPEEIAAALLASARMAAEKEGPVDGAVIAVPAFADTRQRRATVQAARIAGFARIRLVSELSAAVVGLEAGKRGRVALLTMGAGAFDVALAERDAEGTLRTLAVAGDTLLGLVDLDRRLVDHLRGQTEIGREGTVELFEAAAEIRKALVTSARISGQAVTVGGRRIELPAITRELFGALAEEELARIAEPCAWVLEDAGLGTDDLDEVLLFGGGAHEPRLLDSVGYLFRRTPKALVDPEAVARGAAKLIERDEVTEVLPHSVGVKVRGGRMSAVIARNRPIPCEERKVFAPTRDRQSHMLLEIYQGEGELAADNLYLGRFMLEHLAPGVPRTITFALDASGLLSATFGADGGERPAAFHPSGGLSDAQVAELAVERRTAETERKKPSTVPPPPGRKRSLPPPSRGPNAATEIDSHRAAPTSVRPLRRRSRAMVAVGPIAVGDDAIVGATLSDRYVVEAIIASGGMVSCPVDLAQWCLTSGSRSIRRDRGGDGVPWRGREVGTGLRGDGCPEGGTPTNAVSRPGMISFVRRDWWSGRGGGRRSSAA